MATLVANGECLIELEIEKTVTEDHDSRSYCTRRTIRRAMSSGYMLIRRVVITTFDDLPPSKYDSGWKREHKIKKALLQDHASLRVAINNWAKEYENHGYAVNVK
jgi:hypothetical protein